MIKPCRIAKGNMTLEDLTRAVAFAALLVGAAHAALAETGKPPDPKAAVRGAELYRTYCQSCHGERGVGEVPIPPVIRRPGYFAAPALDDSQHAWHHADDALIKIILQGSQRTRRMPAWSRVLSRQDARDLVAYMKSLWSVRAIRCQGPRHMSCK